MDGYFNMVMDFTDQFGTNHSSCGIGTQASDAHGINGSLECCVHVTYNSRPHSSH